MEFLNFNSVELLPNAKASAAFTVDSGKVFSVTSDLQSEVNECQGLRPEIISTYIRGLQIQEDKEGALYNSLRDSSLCSE